MKGYIQDFLKRTEISRNLTLPKSVPLPLLNLDDLDQRSSGVYFTPESRGMLVDLLNHFRGQGNGRSASSIMREALGLLYESLTGFNAPQEKIA